jgi:hypothetical protein
MIVTSQVPNTTTYSARDSSRARCPHCGSPMVEARAYPKRGMRLACLASRVPLPPGVHALGCGAPNFRDAR